MINKVLRIVTFMVVTVVSGQSVLLCAYELRQQNAVIPVSPAQQPVSSLVIEGDSFIKAEGSGSARIQRKSERIFKPKVLLKWTEYLVVGLLGVVCLAVGFGLWAITPWVGAALRMPFV